MRFNISLGPGLTHCALQDESLVLFDEEIPFEALESLAESTYTGFTPDEEDGPRVPRREVVSPSARCDTSLSSSKPRLSGFLSTLGASFGPGSRRGNIGRPLEPRDPLLSDFKLKAMLEANRTRARSTLLDLPSEIRLMVYRLLLVDKEPIHIRRFVESERTTSVRRSSIFSPAESIANSVKLKQLPSLGLGLQLLRVSRSVYAEAIEVLWGENIFLAAFAYNRLTGDLSVQHDWRDILSQAISRFQSLSWRIRRLEFRFPVPTPFELDFSKTYTTYVNDEELYLANALLEIDGTAILPEITVRFVCPAEDCIPNGSFHSLEYLLIVFIRGFMQTKRLSLTGDGLDDLSLIHI